jgi:hypothetical protein
MRKHKKLGVLGVTTVTTVIVRVTHLLVTMIKTHLFILLSYLSTLPHAKYSIQ